MYTIVHLYGKSAPLGFPTNIWDDTPEHIGNLLCPISDQWQGESSAVGFLPHHPGLGFCHAGNGTNGTRGSFGSSIRKLPVTFWG